MNEITHLTRCCSPSGPLDAKIALVGEAPGETEERLGRPFVGYSGQELDRMLDQAGIDPASCFKTNVFMIRPPNNDLKSFCSKTPQEGIPGIPAVKPGYYIRREFGGEYARLEGELNRLRANITVALGGTAAAALTGIGGISKIRGTIFKNSRGLKVLPTYHPAAILRQYHLRAITVLDLVKARGESASPDFTPPQRDLIVNPTIYDLEHWAEMEYPRQAVDIETAGPVITHIGFACSPSQAICIPFVGPYWSEELHPRAAKAVYSILVNPKIKKIFQHGAYDVVRIWKTWGIPVYGFLDDTMLQHHALYPEVQKDLGFLGSVYTREPAWKILRHRAKDEGKRDE